MEEEADLGESISLDVLTGMDVYIEVGRRLATKLAEHYHPTSEDPIQLLPVVDLLTALELASEDLNQLCKQVPGGDMITPGHWKKAVRVANYIQRANDIYSYLLPIFSPMTGLARLGSQHLMVKPAWKNMQQNLLRWFFRAYVNRLGAHLIELYSGRLAIGARQYRKLTRRGTLAEAQEAGEKPRLRIGVAGAQGSGKSRLIAKIRAARPEELARVRERLEADGIDPATIEALKTAEWIEIPAYTTSSEGETSRDRSSRREAIELAASCDYLILVSNASQDSLATDAAFAQGWENWFKEHSVTEIPPAIDILSGVDAPEFGGEWRPPYSWEKGETLREVAIRTRLNAIRGQLPPTFTAIVPACLANSDTSAGAEPLLATLASNIPKAERVSLIRHLNTIAGRSKVARLLRQVGTQGRSVWQGLKAAREARSRR